MLPIDDLGWKSSPVPVDHEARVVVWQGRLGRALHYRDELVRYLGEIEALLRTRSWHRLGAAEADRKLNDESFMRVAARLLGESHWRESRPLPPRAQRLMAEAYVAVCQLTEAAARIEVLRTVIRTGLALGDASGAKIDELLRQLGVEDPTPEHREALFHVTAAVLQRRIHPKWFGSEPPPPLAERMVTEVLLEAKKLQIMYGNGSKLGTEDRSELEVDHRAAQRLEAGRSWDRLKREVGKKGADLPEGLPAGAADPIAAGALEMAYLERLARNDRERVMCRLIAAGANPVDAAELAGASRSAFRALQARAKRRSQ